MARKKGYSVTRDPKVAPTHPGEMFREDMLPALGLSVLEVAQALRVSRQTLPRILAATMGVSPEMTVRLGKFCGNGSGLWLRMQAAYDLWHAEQRMREEARRIPTKVA